MEFHYKPNVELLEKYLKPFPLQFFIPDKSLNSKKKFDDEVYKSLDNIVKERSLHAEHISDYYWVVTEFIQSYSNHEKYQKVAEWNRERNADLLKVLSFYDEAVSSQQTVTISVNVGQKSRSIDDPTSISFLIDHLRELKGRLDDESIERPDFKKEPFDVGAPAISKYLVEGLRISTERERARIIAYLFSIAGLPFLRTIDGERIPLSHTHDDWDEENAIKTVLKYLKKSDLIKN